MMINRRSFIASLSASLSLLPATLANAEGDIPTSRNIKWACSESTWGRYPGPFTDILDVMKDTGFYGIRITGFPGSLQRYKVTEAQMLDEVSKRGLHVVTISWNGQLQDPAARQKVLDSARDSMKFLTDFGANHLVVFSPSRTAPGADTPAAFKELCERCNQIGELAGEMGFTAGLHNHMGTMVQNQDEVNRIMSMTDPKLFGLSPDTNHLKRADCDVVGTLNHYKHRIHMLDYKDAKWTPPTEGKVAPNGKVLPKAAAGARLQNSSEDPNINEGQNFSEDLGDQQVDFPACHRILKSVHFSGWICVDLYTTPLGPMADLHRCGAYIVKKLEPIYL